MTDRPIIMSAPMVNALLDGRKTQTRRLATSPLRKAQPGDRLYVREAFVPWDAGVNPNVMTRADMALTDLKTGYRSLDYKCYGPWRPSIHMPRSLSRLTLVVTEVRRQRLQEISDPDAEAEGVVFETADPPFWYVPGIMPHSLTAVEIEERPRASYAKLWDHLHGAGAWEKNPDVVRISFTVHQANIDALAEEAA